MSYERVLLASEMKLCMLLLLLLIEQYCSSNIVTVLPKLNNNERFYERDASYGRLSDDCDEQRKNY